MNLLVVCFAAFVAVLALLSLLAGLIRLLTVLFPYVDAADEGGDPGLVAAVHAAVAVAHPDFRVTKIEERR